MADIVNFTCRKPHELARTFRMRCDRVAVSLPVVTLAGVDPEALPHFGLEGWTHIAWEDGSSASVERPLRSLELRGADLRCVLGPD